MGHHREEKESYDISNLLLGRTNFPSDCATSNYPRGIPDARTWSFLQSSYKKSSERHIGSNLIVRDNPLHQDRRRQQSQHHEVEEESHTASDEYDAGMTIDMEVREGPRGRGVFVTKKVVPAGTGVWRSGPYSYATFRRPEEMLDFLELLPHDLQCDIFLWAYPTGHKAHVELSESSFVNHAEAPELVNLDPNCYALRDIAVGEELLMDYSLFINKLDWFDDLRAYAWRDLDPAVAEGDGHGEDRKSSLATVDVDAESKRATLSYYLNVGAPDRSSSSSKNTFVDPITIDLSNKTRGGPYIINAAVYGLSLVGLIFLSGRATRRFMAPRKKKHDG